MASLLAHPQVAAARSHLEHADNLTIERQVELSTIPAPTGSETARAARLADLLRDVGLNRVATDPAGNVRAWWGPPDPAPVVLSAHLDTVFGLDVSHEVGRRGPRLEGPGIADNARGLAALVALAEAMARHQLATRRPLLFVATVGEEGAGNLRGVRHLLDAGPELRPHAFIALDGAGLQRVVHRALGSRRYRATFQGPGGHSWAAYGAANPAHAVGDAVAALARIPTDHAPRTTCSVVRLGGGTGLNSIPQSAWLDIDLRSEDQQSLQRLDRLVHVALGAARDAENARRAAPSPPLTLTVQALGDRPSGVTPRAHPLVRAAVAANRALGWEAELVAGSTDANVPISLGIPAIALGAGGRSGDAHLPSEWYENQDGATGIVRALLVTLAVAELAALD